MQEKNCDVILEIIELFQRFLDKARNYDYLPGDLRMAINSINNHMSWVIHKNPHIDILTPHLFFGEVYENLEKRIILVRDQELILRDLLEEIYNMELDDNIEKLIISKGLNLDSLELIRDKHPRAYETFRSRINIAREMSRRYGVNVDNKLDASSRRIWMEVKIKSNHMTSKEKVNEVFTAIDILRQIYKNIFNVNDEEQVYNSEKPHLIDQLMIHLSSLYEIVSRFKKEPIFYDHVGVFEWPGFDGSGFTIRTRIHRDILVEIFATRRTNKYILSILVKSSSENIVKIQNRLKKEAKENKIYYEKKDITLEEVVNEIKNVIHTATK